MLIDGRRVAHRVFPSEAERERRPNRRHVHRCAATPSPPPVPSVNTMGRERLDCLRDRDKVMWEWCSCRPRGPRGILKAWRAGPRLVPVGRLRKKSQVTLGRLSNSLSLVHVDIPSLGLTSQRPHLSAGKTATLPGVSAIRRAPKDTQRSRGRRPRQPPRPPLPSSEGRAPIGWPGNPRSDSCRYGISAGMARAAVLG